MKNSSTKLHIYKGMIQYLLESTNYTIQAIAEFSDSPINYIHSIHFDDFIPAGFASESQLIKLFHIVINLNTEKPKSSRFMVEINEITN